MKKIKLKSTHKIKRKLLPPEIIRGAVQYDIESIEAVMAHFNGYISKLSTVELYDKEGRLHYVLDENIQYRLESKLIDTLHKFRKGTI
jgi:hypothetical protein